MTIGGMQGDTFGGYTAIATYALLASGENRSDPRISKAVQFLEDADIIGIYALGLRANVWALLPGDRRARIMAERDAQLIINGMQTGQGNPRHEGILGLRQRPRRKPHRHRAHRPQRQPVRRAGIVGLRSERSQYPPIRLGNDRRKLEAASISRRRMGITVIRLPAGRGRGNRLSS